MSSHTVSHQSHKHRWRAALVVVSALSASSKFLHADAFTTAPSTMRPPGSILLMTQKNQFNRVTLSMNENDNENEGDGKMKTTTSSEGPSDWFNPFKDMRPSTALATAALATALMMAPMSADAAMSGGRMGGSFSAPRSSGSSRMMPSPGSYSRGYSQGYQSGFGSGYYSRPSVTVSPFVTPFYNPFFFPRPFYGGPGIVAVSRGPSFFDLLFFGGITFLIVNTIRSAAEANLVRNIRQPWDMWSEGENVASALGSGTSVASISVAFEVPNRDDPNSILGVLNRLSQTAKTDSRVGIQNLTSQVALEMLRRKSSIVSATTKYKHFADRSRAQRDFSAISIKERGKFESETVSKYGGVDYSSSDRRSRSGMDGQATMAVVTLLIAIDGDSTKLPSVRSIADVEDALRRIAADAKVEDCLQSAEILWTPEDRSETLTMRDVIADYPELRSV